MSTSLSEWLDEYVGCVRRCFGDRVLFVGLQGSHGRGEAGKDSDIDLVLILDHASADDLCAYDAAISDLPQREKICGSFPVGTNCAVGARPISFSSTTTPRHCWATWRPCCRLFPRRMSARLLCSAPARSIISAGITSFTRNHRIFCRACTNRRCL